MENRQISQSEKIEIINREIQDLRSKQERMQDAETIERFRLHIEILEAIKAKITA